MTNNVFIPDVTVDSDLTVDSTVTVDTGAFDLNLPSLSAATFASRLLNLFPRGWLSDSAKTAGGNAYATFLGIGTPLASLLTQMQFVASGLRIKLAYGTALDTLAVDYFGVNGLPRNPGESDIAYRLRILQTLLVPRVTRDAIKNAIEAATGITPRMGEPWSPGDCMAWDVNSYYDVDGAQNIAPCRYGDTLAYTGFVDLTAPINTVTGGYPIYGYDIGWAWDIAASALDLSGLNGVASIDSTFEQTVYSTIQRFKALGITVGVRLTAQAALSNTVSGFLASTSGATLIGLSDTAISFTLQSWMQAFGVWIEVLPWTTSSYLSKRGTSFNFTTDAAATGADTIGWLAAIFTTTNPLALRVPVNYGQTSVACAFTPPLNTVPIITIDYDALVSVTAFSADTLTIGVEQLAAQDLETESSSVLETESGEPLTVEYNESGGNLDIVFLPGSSSAVAASATTAVITDASLPSTYALFATPSWATAMSIAKGSGTFTLTFGTAAPAGGGTVYWAAVEN